MATPRAFCGYDRPVSSLAMPVEGQIRHLPSHCPRIHASPPWHSHECKPAIRSRVWKNSDPGTAGNINIKCVGLLIQVKIDFWMATTSRGATSATPPWPRYQRKCSGRCHRAFRCAICVGEVSFRPITELRYPAAILPPSRCLLHLHGSTAAWPHVWNSAVAAHSIGQ